MKIPYGEGEIEIEMPEENLLQGIDLVAVEKRDEKNLDVRHSIEEVEDKISEEGDPKETEFLASEQNYEADQASDEAQRAELV